MFFLDLPTKVLGVSFRAETWLPDVTIIIKMATISDIQVSLVDLEIRSYLEYVISA